MNSIIEIFYNYLHGEVNRIIEVVSDIKSPFYTWFFFVNFYKDLPKVEQYLTNIKEIISWMIFTLQ